MIPDEDLHRHAAETLAQADALIFGRVTYELMETGWREVARTGVPPEWMPEWALPFAHTIDAAKKYVVSGTLKDVDWNAEVVRGDQLEAAVQELKRQPGKGLLVGGVTLPAGVGRTRIDRRIRVRGAAQDRRPRPDTVIRTFEGYRSEARAPDGIQVRGVGDGVQTGVMKRLDDFPRAPLMFGPSPFHPLTRLSAALGGKVEIWAKREDCNSGIAFGGNTVRKLEYLAADALAKGCDTRRPRPGLIGMVRSAKGPAQGRRFR